MINDARVPRFIADSVGSTDTQCHGSVGLEVDGKIKAAASFDNFNGANAFIHFSNSPNVGIVPRGFLTMVFTYAFRVLKVRRLSAAFADKDRRVCRLGEICGFKFEATLRGACPQGDLVIYKLLPEDCRFLLKNRVRDAVESVPTR